jgi:rhamnose transport system ATP-binding protein
MVGRELAEEQPRSGTVASGGPILDVRGLTAEPAFRNVCFSVRPGEIVGIGGLVGAGRTDVCRALFGVTRPSAGEVRIQGQAVAIRSPRDAMGRGIAMVPEDRQHEGLLLPMSIAQNVTLARLPQLFRRGWLNQAREKEVANSAVTRIRTVLRSVAQPIRQLSGGNQQKVVLAKWLLTEPRILILDEPTRGVDVGAKAEVHRLIRELVADGLAILVVSSDLPELLSLSDRVLVMREGNLVAEFDRDQATPDRVMLAATGQEAHAG